MASPSFQMQTLEAITGLLPKLQVSDSACLFPLIEREISYLLAQLPPEILQDQLSTLETLALLRAHVTASLSHGIGSTELIDSLIELYIKEACNSLSQARQESLTELLSTLQRLLGLRETSTSRTTERPSR